MTEVEDWELSCPLCGGANKCAFATGQSIEDCWCNEVTISAEALSSIPAESVNRRCLCAACGTITVVTPDER